MPRPPETYSFFLDRCLGTSVVREELRRAGAAVEVHDDHFPQDCRDEDWLAEIGGLNWVLLTKDTRIRYRPAEKEALIRAKVAAFVLTGGDMTGEEIGQAFAKALPHMKRVLRNYRRPIFATVSRSGRVFVHIGERIGSRRKR